jgi:ribonuclease HI
MNYDGATCREGAIFGVWINHPEGDTKLCSYKLIFECTNNMTEYEALILGLKVLEELGAKRIVVHGDYELIINQIKGIYQAKHPRLRDYRNLVLELLEKFEECNLSSIPREKNQIVDALATSAAVFRVPIFPEKSYKVEVKYNPAVLDNMKHWQVFENDKQIESFLKMENEFENLNIDNEYCDDEVDAATFMKEGYFDNQITGRDIVLLKINIIPKGLVPLEKIFDNNDVSRNPKITVNEGDVEDFNIGPPEDPKIMKLSRKLNLEIR